MIRKLGMAFMEKLFFLDKFQFQPLINSFALCMCIWMCLVSFVCHTIYLCDASIDEAYGIHHLQEDKSCKVGREMLTLSAPSAISCMYYCSGQLQTIGFAYTSDNGACKCCSEIGKPEGSTTTGRTKLYSISRNKDTPLDCGALIPKGTFKSGVYTVYPNGQTAAEVFCDFDDSDGPWTVIQRRVDGTVDFYRSYKSYQDGFGNLSGNFWLGLDTISTLTLHSDKTYSLKVILVDTVEGEKFAKYSEFAVMNSSTGYLLNVKGYSGTSGDSLTYHHGCAFSTFDMDRDNWESDHCAILYAGAWWYRECLHSCLNGIYENSSRAKGIVWLKTTSFDRSALFATMKLKENN